MRVGLLVISVDASHCMYLFFYIIFDFVDSTDLVTLDIVKFSVRQGEIDCSGCVECLHMLIVRNTVPHLNIKLHK